jgi:CRISPR-associated protein Cmr2
MESRLAEIKIEALLHDPPGKAPTLWYRRHADFSARLIEMTLGRAPIHVDLIKEADHCAAGTDRAGLPRDPVDYRVDFLARPEIVHPLSGTKYSLRPLRDLDPGRLEDEQRKVVEHLVQLGGGPGADPERLWWYLWRGLEDALLVLPDGLGRLWRHLPADTRIPDHSIWDHMRLASAFAGTLPEPALLVFSFGPVQVLIEAARRTGDLWAGSFFLSWLCWQAMQDLVAEMGADAVIFPDLKRQPLVDAWLRGRGWSGIPGLAEPSQIASLPNRFLALVPWGRGKTIAERCETGFRSAAMRFAEGCVEDLLRDTPAAERRRSVRRAADQVLSSLFCQWHVLPWQEADAGLRERSRSLLGPAIDHAWASLDSLAPVREYRPNRGSYFPIHTALVEAAHGAAKASRTFAQGDDQKPRCTVCGMRGRLWDDDGAGLRGVRQAERLCGLCAARRRAPRSEWAAETVGRDVLFPSTHNLAATRFYNRVLDVLIRADSGGDNKDERVMVEALEEFAERARTADSQYATEALMRKARQCGRYRAIAERLVKLPAELLEPATYEDLATLVEYDLDEVTGRATRAALDQFRKAWAAAAVGSPGAYYGIMAMDGDHMGKWLSGELSPFVAQTLHDGALPRTAEAYRLLGTVKRPLTAAHQGALSRALNEFSLEIVEEVVELAHGGVVVYAGGDDAVAMLPLQSVVPCLRDLRRLYSGLPLHEGSRAGGGEFGFRSGSGWIEGRGGLWRTMGERATCSMGVAIAHAKWPLRHTLETARQMERLAKRGLDRNAVAIATMKRSGGHEQFAARWGHAETLGIVAESGGAPGLDPLAPIEDVATLIETGRVSRRFAYGLREEARVIWDLPDAIRERARWLLERHWRKGKDNPFDPGLGDRVARDLQTLAAFLGHDRLQGPHVPAEDEPASRFIAALGIADFIARVGGERE